MRGEMVFVVAGAAVVVALAQARPAHACGGTFCSQSPDTVPVPVDQTAERILFEVEDDGSVTATVEISYTGDPQAFSWIVPVPETPTLDVVPAETLRAIDRATRPVVVPPQQVCTRPPRPPPPLIPPLFPSCSSVPGGNAEPQSSENVVGVERLPPVGPYGDIVVVDSADSAALVTWLNDNGYVVTPAMEPVIAEYVAEDFKFLAVKLAPDVGVSDITPLRFTCPGQDGAPLIPLRLTGIAAAPEMSIVVMIAGAERFAPATWRELELSLGQIKASESTGQSNYYALASWRIDEEAGGKGFIVEHAGPAELVSGDASTEDQPSVEAARAILDRHAYLTRFYTRISGWEMDEDPVFVASGGADFDRRRELPGRGEEVCDAPGPPGRQRCGDTYCGVGSACATSRAGDGCVCAEGTVARRVLTPAGPSVFCQERSADFLASLSTLAGVCEQATCGEDGACRVVNGFPACECDEGFAAVAVAEPGLGDTGVRCLSAGSPEGPEALLWPDYEPAPPFDDDDVGGCDSTSSHGPKSIAFFLALAWGALVVVRRALARRP